MTASDTLQRWQDMKQEESEAYNHRARRASPDGYTLLTLPASYPATAAMYRTLSYRPVDDFSMISMTVEYPIVWVTYSDHPIKTVSDLVAKAKSQDSPLQYGTAGIGSLQHL